MEQEHRADGSGELGMEQNLEKSVWKKVTTLVNVTENFKAKELLRFGVRKILIVKNE